MISLRYTIVILLSIIYGIALTSKNNSKCSKLSELSNLIFAFSCITSISFMSAVFEINRRIENLCYVIMLVLVLGVPIITKFIITKFLNKRK